MYEPDNPEAVKFQSLIDEKIALGMYSSIIALGSVHTKRFFKHELLREQFPT